MCHYDRARLCTERILDREVEIIAMEHTVALTVNGGTLLVDDVVELNDALTNIEVVSLNARLCPFNGSAHH